MLVCISVDSLSVRLRGLPDFWDPVYSESPKEVKGCCITPACVPGEAEMRRMKISLRQAGTETSKAEKWKKALPWTRRSHMVLQPRDDSQVTAEFYWRTTGHTEHCITWLCKIMRNWNKEAKVSQLFPLFFQQDAGISQLFPAGWSCLPWRVSCTLAQLSMYIRLSWCLRADSGLAHCALHTAHERSWSPLLADAELFWCSIFLSAFGTSALKCFPLISI